MAYNFGDVVGFPEAESDTQPVDTGRLAGLFCQLHRRNFTGLLHVENADAYCVFSFRNGTIVFVEDSTPGESIADHMLGNGLITREQYADVVSRMTESLVDNEDLMFCEQAIALGYVSQDDVSSEMSQRVRSKIISAMSFQDCRVELDESPDSLVLAAEYPQELGALVYIGVRTFYEESLLESFVPQPSSTYMRLLRPLPAVAEFFALDGDEEKFLRALDPESTLDTLIDTGIVDHPHAIQMIALLRIAGMVELGTTAFVATPEPSGVRSASAMMRGRSITQDRLDTSAARRRTNRPPGGDPRREPESRPPTAPVHEVLGSAARRPIAREEPGEARPAARVERTQAREERPFGGQPPRPRSASSSDAVPVQRQAPAQMATPAAAARGGTAPATPKATSAVAPAAPPKKEMDDATAQALAEAKARAASRAAAGVGAVQRLGRQLEHLRGAGSVAARPPTVSIPASVPVTAPANAGGNAASGDPEYAKAHLKEILMRRRQVSRPEPTGRTVADKPRDPVQDLKTAQDLLREKHFGKAEELLRAVVEANPQNEMARLFWVWSKVRSAQEPDGKDLEELRDGARKLVQNEEHGAFACYVLGHLAFVAKKDDVAEKFFRKAFARDKTMKDAERHILILERRKQVLANAEAQNNVKLFGITIKKG